MKTKLSVFFTLLFLVNPVWSEPPDNRTDLIMDLLNSPPGNSMCENHRGNISFEECVTRLKASRQKCPELISDGIPEKLDNKNKHLLFGRWLACLNLHLEGSKYQNSDWDDGIMKHWKEPRSNAEINASAIAVSSYIYKKDKISIEVWSNVCDQDPDISTMSCLTPPKETNIDGCVKTPGLCFYRDDDEKLHSFVLSEGVIVFSGKGKSLLKAKELAQGMGAQIRLYKATD